MDTDQALVVLVLAVTFVLFVWGRWRYDAVALLALLALVLGGVIPGDQAFADFGHPAVVTVAAVLVVSRGLQNSGAVDVLARWLTIAGTSPTRQIAATSGLAAALSGFINNVGALAVLMPTALRTSRQAGIRPSVVLMPLAFASLLGGLVTLVGTPPNIVIATFRSDATGEAFAMFDFAPVGLGVAVVGLAFVSLVGWRLIPRREEAASEDLFEISDYLFEVRIPEGSQTDGRSIAELGRESNAEFVVVAVVRGESRLELPSSFELLRAGDVLVVEASSEALEALVVEAGLEAAGADHAVVQLGGGDIVLAEAVITPGSLLRGRTVVQADLRQRHHVNVLAVSRSGRLSRARVQETPLRVGDVLLFQANRHELPATLEALQCLPLAERGVSVGRRERRALLAVSIFGGALMMAAALRLLPIQVAMAGAAAVMGLVGLVSPREVYESIDWRVIVLLGAMIPVGGALEETGLAAEVASALVAVSGDLPLWTSVAAVLVISMFLSDVVNNTAAAVLMAPIALGVAGGLSASADPFLMAVAVGASAAFLTPIGHQSNLLVMGPGGYQFGDYWRLGLPLEVVITVVAVPLILLVWPA
ncbi:MAG: SLC13 family permease [Chloroflexi bacterium]|nr:SLC13 family permease [Chloroflexota bacterium]